MGNLADWISNQENITFAIAVIGCITGVCSLVLNFYKAISEKPKLKIEILKPYLNGFTENRNRSYESETVLAIHLSFSNIGTYPVSISDAFIKQMGLMLRNVAGTGNSIVEIKNENGSVTHYRFYDSCEFPLFVGVGEVSEVTLLFPFADELFKLYNEGKVKRVKITICTPNKKMHKTVSVAKITKESIAQRITRKRPLRLLPQSKHAAK